MHIASFVHVKNLSLSKKDSGLELTWSSRSTSLGMTYFLVTVQERYDMVLDSTLDGICWLNGDQDPHATSSMCSLNFFDELPERVVQHFGLHSMDEGLPEDGKYFKAWASFLRKTVDNVIDGVNRVIDANRWLGCQTTRRYLYDTTMFLILWFIFLLLFCQSVGYVLILIVTATVSFTLEVLTILDLSAVQTKFSSRTHRVTTMVDVHQENVQFILHPFATFVAFAYFCIFFSAVLRNLAYFNTPTKALQKDRGHGFCCFCNLL